MNIPNDHYPIPELKNALELGLKEDEWQKIETLLCRKPNFTELSMFSVMWSEHCCYKNSIVWLKKLPKEGAHILAKAGEENAGLVDIGDGLACCFKIESHNHPSAIEPYQGAATGVGGISRDIFTMGARPIASLNSLRFGDFSHFNTKHLVKGVVKGIGDYGNCFGVPTVGGEVYFDSSYNINPLVNAMSAGIVKIGETVSATAGLPGNKVYIVGSATGKDGIHGASFASADLTEDSSEELPSVQVGDPFMEKLLLEASLEAIAAKCIAGMQDMGAAGIVCSTSEMSAKGEVGMKIDLSKVPTRQQFMKPWEMLLSESQERMLVVVEPGKEAIIENIFKKWDLNCAIIGEVIAEKTLEYYFEDNLVAKVNPISLVLGGESPVYNRTMKEPLYFKEIEKYKIENVTEPSNIIETALQLISQPNIASKRWIYEQYDSMVQLGNMHTNMPTSAAVVRIKENNKALALTVDCNPYYVHANPEIGTAIAVSEAARNIVCSGGIPLAITNCLNFGNPYNEEVFYQFANAIMGMKRACEKFETPVTGGNVSFYNQSNDAGPVLPTPTIGMMGIINDKELVTGIGFSKPGHLIYLIGTNKNDISSSQYLIHLRKIEFSPAPFFNLDEEFNNIEIVKNLISNKVIQSAHDISEGGLWVNLLESAMVNNLGFVIETDSNLRADALLFGESQGRIIVSVDPANREAVEKMIGNHGKQIGTVTADTNLFINNINLGDTLNLKHIYNNCLSKLMND
jgi:phosphoribosylformylglycinamidine synthase II